MKRPNPFKSKNMRRKLNIQLGVAVMLTIAGVTLLFMGFWIEPTGQIDNSVLIAFGEISTFAGTLFGVDYTYKFKSKRFINDKETER